MSAQHPKAPYLVQRAGAPGGVGYGLGWVAMHRPTGVGVHRRSQSEALAWVWADSVNRGIRELINERTA